MTFEQMNLLTNRLNSIIQTEIKFLKRKRLKAFMDDVRSAFGNDDHAIQLISAAEEEIQ